MPTDGLSNPAAFIRAPRRGPAQCALCEDAANQWWQHAATNLAVCTECRLRVRYVALASYLAVVMSMRPRTVQQAISYCDPSMQGELRAAHAAAASKRPAESLAGARADGASEWALVVTRDTRPLGSESRRYEQARDAEIVERLLFRTPVARLGDVASAPDRRMGIASPAAMIQHAGDMLARIPEVIGQQEASVLRAYAVWSLLCHARERSAMRRATRHPRERLARMRRDRLRRLVAVTAMLVQG